MQIHILGICGTFMGGIASIARQLGHEVSGTDENVYPPMSTLLQNQDINLYSGYEVSHLLEQVPDCVIIGNAIKRGNPMVEYVLNKNIPYYSGAEWLFRYVLQDKWVLAVSGTHGKTTTSGMLAWILEYAGLKPGFLIGGVPGNFSVSARAGETPFFVIEADEYDTAFFDKRSKFLHYHPRTLIINNLEFDHADIFDNLKEIQKQFHHLVRIVPSEGLIISPTNDQNVQQVLAMGCWSQEQSFGQQGAWSFQDCSPDGSSFSVTHEGKARGQVVWQLVGMHNVYNALAAIAAARHVGITPAIAIEALNTFVNAKRRLEVKGIIRDITVYDDFAHHPTAIATTLTGLRNKVGKNKRIFAVLDFASYTMRTGVHKDTIYEALHDADYVLLKKPESCQWSLETIIQTDPSRISIFDSIEQIIQHLVANTQPSDQILLMSNRSFDGIYDKLLKALEK